MTTDAAVRSLSNQWYAETFEQLVSRHKKNTLRKFDAHLSSNDVDVILHLGLDYSILIVKQDLTV